MSQYANAYVHSSLLGDSVLMRLLLQSRSQMRHGERAKWIAPILAQFPSFVALKHTMVHHIETNHLSPLFSRPEFYYLDRSDIDTPLRVCLHRNAFFSVYT